MNTIFRRIGGRIVPIISKAIGDVKNVRHAVDSAKHINQASRAASLSERAGKLAVANKIGSRINFSAGRATSDSAFKGAFMKSGTSMGNRAHSNAIRAEKLAQKSSELGSKVESGKRGIKIVSGVSLAGLAAGILGSRTVSNSYASKVDKKNKVIDSALKSFKKK